MDTDSSLEDYDRTLLSMVAAEAVHVMRAFGFAGAHVILIGGLVPSLLVPSPEPGLDAHVGTRDLDLCLSVALVSGDVGEYERLEKSLRGAGFDMVREGGQPQSWRWTKAGSPIIVEFFCAATDGRVEGKLHRPGGVVGGKLSALTLAAGSLIDRDVREIEVEVELPDGGGRTLHSLKVAGPASFLASKVDALRKRNKNKDAYDVVWLVECWPGGQPSLARVLVESPIFGELQPTLHALESEFASIDAAGAVKYGRFMAHEAEAVDRESRRAVAAIGELLTEIRLARATGGG